MGHPEALVAGPIVLEFRVALQERPIGLEGPRAGRPEALELIDDAVLAEHVAAGRDERAVELELARYVVARVVRVENHHHRASGFSRLAAHALEDLRIRGAALDVGDARVL